MKKAITLFAICLLAFAGTQTAQAQTKEETIAWIKEKLNHSTEFIIASGEHSSYGNFVVKNVNECAITITYSYKYSNGEDNYEQTLPVKGVTIDDKGRFSYSSEVVVDKNITKGKNNFLKKGEFVIVETEQNLRMRMLKALQHLATFCVEKKQTF